MCKPLTLDRKSARAEWKRARKTENFYGSALRKIARHIGHMARAFDPHNASEASALQALLERYAQTIEPWAQAVGTAMVTEVARRDEQTWKEMSREIGRHLGQEIRSAPIGARMRELVEEQVYLIKSLPLEAASRVQALAVQAQVSGERPADLVAEIMRTGEVTLARANLIARTEVGRASTALTQARAEYVGSSHFIWRTAGDSDVRPTHRALNGKSFRWDDPPECDPGHNALPGSIWNCFPGSVTVPITNGVRRVYRAPFSGQVVDITAAGQLLSATGNHPILTTRGWVAACEVGKGDHLIQAVNQAQLIVDADENEANPTFDEMYRAFASRSERAHGVEFDFYGDRPNGDVDTIVFKHPLSDDDMLKAIKRGGDLALPNANGGVIPVTRCGSSHVLETLGTGAGEKSNALFLRSSRHANDVGIATAATSNPALLQDAGDHAAIDGESLTQDQLALAGLIEPNDFALGQTLPVGSGASTANDRNPFGPEALAEVVRVSVDRLSGFIERTPFSDHRLGDGDKVRSDSWPEVAFQAFGANGETEHVGGDADGGSCLFKRGTLTYKAVRVSEAVVRDFSGHVYTLETSEGWYTVTDGSFVAKNCRCYAEPIIPD